MGTATPGRLAYEAYMKALCGGSKDRWEYQAPHLQAAWEAAAEAARKTVI